MTEATPFYAEAGGQVADLGTISSASGASFDVTDVKKVGPYVFHVGKVTSTCPRLSLAVPPPP